MDSACLAQYLGELFCEEANHRDEFEEPENWWKGVPGTQEGNRPFQKEAGGHYGWKEAGDTGSQTTVGGTSA